MTTDEPSIGPKAVSDTESGMDAQTSPSSNELELTPHRIHKFVCDLMDLDDEDHENDEITAPLEAAFTRLLLQAQITELKILSSHHYTINLEEISGLDVVNYSSIADRIAALTKQMEE